MNKLTDIKVIVSTRYEPSISKSKEYFFSYLIEIHNQSHLNVQLLYRYWEITDLSLGRRNTEGEGVVGKKPIIRSNERYKYSSFCFLKSPIGMMKGAYKMVDIHTQKDYVVSIPNFTLYLPHKLN